MSHDTSSKDYKAKILDICQRFARHEGCEEYNCEICEECEETNEETQEELEELMETCLITRDQIISIIEEEIKSLDTDLTIECHHGCSCEDTNEPCAQGCSWRNCKDCADSKAEARTKLKKLHLAKEFMTE